MQVSGGHTGRRESAPALLASYESLLAHLKHQGALLNSVKPELLLDIADFRYVLPLMPSCSMPCIMHHAYTDDTCIAAAELVYLEPHLAVMRALPPTAPCHQVEHHHSLHC